MKVIKVKKKDKRIKFVLEFTMTDEVFQTMDKEFKISTPITEEQLFDSPGTVSDFKSTTTITDV